jgi:hypothetical protein
MYYREEQESEQLYVREETQSPSSQASRLVRNLVLVHLATFVLAQ